jgi:ssRNA-specific RNase YbeY (16S rRNA maturation enzyme)
MDGETMKESATVVSRIIADNMSDREVGEILTNAAVSAAAEMPHSRRAAILLHALLHLVGFLHVHSESGATASLLREQADALDKIDRATDRTIN